MQLARLAGRLSMPGSILCFHGLIAAKHRAPAGMHIPADHLAYLIATVRSLAEIVSLRELLKRRANGRSTSGLVALTFDDAYQSVAEFGRQIIEGAEVPITLLVVSDAADSGMLFWWDRLEVAFSHTPSARWRTFEVDVGLPDEFRIGQPLAYGRLRPLRQWLLSVHRGCPPAKFDDQLLALEQEVGSAATQRPMSWEELRRLSELPQVDIAVHTRSHPVLPLLSDDEVRLQLRQASEAIAAHLPAYLPVLAAPFGFFDARTVSLAQSVGIRTTLTLGNRTLRGADGVALVPRFSVNSGETAWRLLAKLSGTVELVRRHRGIVEPPTLPSATT
jgi:peptidoglycan/xylan/chitin deacetylase (PgdA/CDA1 family)